MAHEKSNLIGCVSFVNTYGLLILLDCGYFVVSGVLVVFILLHYEYSVKASAGERAQKLIFTASSLIPQQEAVDQTITCTLTGVAHSVIIIAGLPRARSALGTEPHTHRLWSASFPLVVT